MTGSVYVVASGKGGVGKTVTAANLAVGLRLQDRTVAVVDADLGMPNLADLLGISSDATIHDVLAGDATVTDVVAEKASGFGVVLGDRSLDRFMDADPERLGDAIAALDERYDHVIVDTGAGLSLERLLPIGLADEVLLVTTPDPPAVENARKIVWVAEFLDRPVRGAVVTRVGDADAAAAALDLDTELLAAVPDDPAVPDSVRAQKPLEVHAPDSDAAGAYRQLAATLAEDAPPRRTR